MKLRTKIKMLSLESVRRQAITTLGQTMLLYDCDRQKPLEITTSLPNMVIGQSAGVERSLIFRSRRDTVLILADPRQEVTDQPGKQTST